MARELKVFGGIYDGIHRCIVAATTKKAAYEAFQRAMGGMGSYPTWNEYTSDSGNEEELKVALPEPLVVFKMNTRNRDAKFERVISR